MTSHFCVVAFPPKNPVSEFSKGTWQGVDTSMIQFGFNLPEMFGKKKRENQLPVYQTATRGGGGMH
jgi:hypothetical protein